MPPSGFSQPPLVASDEIYSVTFRTEPMNKPTAIVGPMALHLDAEIDNDDTNWIVRVYDVTLSGKKTILSMDFCGPRTGPLDKKLSRPYRPYHLHTSESLEQIQPGKIYNYAIELIPMAHEFKVGHFLELEIRNTESPRTRSSGSLPRRPSPASGKKVAHWIYHDKIRQSHLYLPFVSLEEK